ncbi:unnamed protein product [Caenorhabditis auriculariae]|uniref:Methanethiol oxidase n=1 Tax=Caenorhabditis auriculariae TaxID=2777116 RepID=A0A8S1HU82_9PELO|nr:unnamed protein product [Caenorhabditis auriculariae]
MASCGGCGPGYASPAEATKAPREKVLLVTAPHAQEGHDAIFSIDVDPESETYTKVISRVDLPNIGDEVHHTGWNACSSCHEDSKSSRSHLIVPCLNSDRIYIIDARDVKNLRLEKTIESEDLKKHDVSFPHTSHCLADKNCMISTLGNGEGEGKGDFILLDSETFSVKGKWSNDESPLPLNYDFWYQPRCDVMISTEWGVPNLIKKGFDLADVANGTYGNSIQIFQWSTRKRIQTIDLPLPNGHMPLEIRFLHEPSEEHAFVGCALGSTVYHIQKEKNTKEKYEATEVIAVPSKKVNGWILDQMPALITDILISMNDRFLFFACWLHGDVRQYDISDPENPRLVGQVYIGGAIHDESGVTVEGEDQVKALYVKGTKVEGGPQMLQLSLDSRRLYVTTSLYKKWDAQFYPGLLKKGATMVQIDVDPNGGMKINQDFLVDFGAIEGGPYLAHEMRYPGGDCTSDIWV